MPHAVDLHVGQRVLLRRRLLGLSQHQLAKSLGVSFQQVQKYERGDNRVSASRLHQIATTLRVPPAFFFAGYEDSSGEGLPPTEAFHSNASLRLQAALNRLSPLQQDRLLALAEVMGR